jgi:uncharacterized protein YndB with AHSA1/START domain
VSRHHVASTAVAAAPIETVWALVADITTWSQWGQWDATTRVREGVPAPDGVGARREFRRGRRTHVEEVVALEAPRRLAYEVRSGLPVRDYHAELTLEPVGGGTRIRWVADFDGANAIAGWAVHWVLVRFFPEAARRLARAAEAVGPASS